MRRELLLLREMIDAATRIRETIGGLDAGGLREDALRRDAVLWNFMVLGEAANQLPDEIKAQHGEIDWSKPTQLRNKIVHGYWDVSFHILHDTAAQVLPVFIEQLRGVVAELELRPEGD